VAPVGANTGTTIGEQRLIAFQYAIDKWAVALDSPVEIRIDATFHQLDCNSTEVTLGDAGPVSVFSDFAGAPAPSTFYPSALADRLAGMDLAPDDDISAEFNSTFGSAPSGRLLLRPRRKPPGDDLTRDRRPTSWARNGTHLRRPHHRRKDGRPDDAFMQFLVDD
jgi:hypothetical protein